MAVSALKPLSDGTIRWRAQFRLNGDVTQRTFEQERGAREFDALGKRIGYAAAVRVLEARNELGRRSHSG